MNKKRIFCKILSILCAVCAIGFATFFLHTMREFIIQTAENILGRNLNHEKWMAELFNRGIVLTGCFIAYSVGFYFLSIIKFSESKESIPLFVSPKKLYKSGKPYFFCLLSCFFLISSVKFYWLGQKKGFHEDEIYTLSIVNTSDIGFWHTSEDFEACVPYSGKEIKESVFFDDNSIKDTVHDLFKLWVFDDDTPHPNLYYVLERLAFFMTKTYDHKTLFFRVGLLNFILFCVSFFFLNLIFEKTVQSKTSRIILLLIAFLNPASIGLGLFMRPYPLLETTLILFAYIFSEFFHKISQDKAINTKSNLIKGAVVISLALDTQYTALIFIALLGLAILILCYKRNKPKEAFFFITMFLLGFIFARILYLDYGAGFIDGRGVSDGFFITVKLSTKLMAEFVSDNFINIFAILIIFFVNFTLSVLYARKNRKSAKIAYTAPILFICSFLWMYTVNYLGPIKTLRYTAPAFPFFTMGFIPYIFPSKKNHLYTVLQIAILAFILTKTVPCKSNAKNIEHIDDSKPQYSNAEYFKYPDETVFIEFGSSYEKILPYLNDSQTYYFVNSKEDTKNIKKSKKFWYLSDIKNSGGVTTIEHLEED